MQFLPKADLLTLEELDRLSTAFIGLACASCASPAESLWSVAASWAFSATCRVTWGTAWTS